MKRELALAVAIVVISVGAAAAQDPIERAEREYRQGMISVYEDALFKITKKTTSIIYAKQITFGDGSLLVCGEALFGSSRRAFFVNTSTGATNVGASKAVLKNAGCDADDGEILIDLR